MHILIYLGGHIDEDAHMIAMQSIIISVLVITVVLFYVFYRQRNQILGTLRNSEAQMRLFLESVGDGVFGVDLDGNCTFINSSALRILGFNSAQDVVGENIHSMIHHTQRDGTPCLNEECNIYRAFRENQCFHINNEILWRIDGTHFDVEYRSNPIVLNGQVTGAVASFSDITERRQAEEALRISEEKYHNIFDSILDVYAEISLDGTILEVSPSAELQTGFSRDELLGKNMNSFYARAGDREKLLEQLYRDGQINDYEALMVDKNGKERFYSYTGKIIMDASGKPQKLAGVMRDIAERKQAESARKLAENTLRKAHDELEQRVAERTKELALLNEELKKEIIKQKQAEEQARQHQVELAHMARLNTMGEMATGMAHELNQPLTAISTSADACLRITRKGNEISDKLPKALESIISQARRAGEIIQHLRKFVKKQSPQKITIDLNQLVMEVFDMTKTEMKQHHIELVLELNKSLPKLMADGIQIEQVLLNLVRNSIESMEHAKRLTRKLIVRTDLNPEGLVQADVIDNGLGINTDELSHVFEPFVTTKGVKGMGMGLSISRSIIEAHNGRLWAKSHPGEGASFHFTLPVNIDDSI